ncbi:hypothetical protein SmJEL517_g02167 [Synchytrium microbalum]|uniref:FHA domain-containing protein n=1 Tax=Synchytrium microbalum TaxID=1806994 RepID=A0A507C8C8_9FUNG|nr:uncharacterized protein SmJEL517_g02167 [Synchytrium microbalum]TPX35578.1 hypothetical protein SmJEL517_g02167 [Synchytrium microbalum]
MSVRGSLINPILDQLVLESQSLIQIYQNAIKATNEKCPEAGTERALMLADACSSSNTISGRNLQQQWDTIKMLCRSMERTLPGHSKGIVESADNMSRTVNCLVNGIQDADSFQEANFPVQILGLLHSVKAAIKLHMAKESELGSLRQSKASSGSAMQLHQLFGGTEPSSGGSSASAVSATVSSVASTATTSPLVEPPPPQPVNQQINNQRSSTTQPRVSTPQRLSVVTQPIEQPQPEQPQPRPSLFATQRSSTTGRRQSVSERPQSLIFKDAQLTTQPEEPVGVTPPRRSVTDAIAKFEAVATSESANENRISLLADIPAISPIAWTPATTENTGAGVSRSKSTRKIPPPPMGNPPPPPSDDDEDSSGGSDLSRQKTLVAKKRNRPTPRSGSNRISDPESSHGSGGSIRSKLSNISPNESTRPESLVDDTKAGVLPVSKARELFESKSGEQPAPAPSTNLRHGREPSKTSKINVDAISAKYQDKVGSTTEQNDEDEESTDDFVPKNKSLALASPDLKTTLASIDNILAAAGVPLDKNVIANTPPTSNGAMGVASRSSGAEPTRSSGSPKPLRSFLTHGGSAKSLFQQLPGVFGVTGATFGDKAPVSSGKDSATAAGRRLLEKASSVASLERANSMNLAPGTGHSHSVSVASGDMSAELDTPMLMLMPLNDMFEMCYLNLTEPVKMGRGSSVGKSVKTFDTRVVSRNHTEMFSRDGKFYLKDVGSNGGTYLNGVRLSGPGELSKDFEVNSGDLIQLGKDYVELGPNGSDVQHKCVKFQVASVAGKKRNRPTSVLPSNQSSMNEDLNIHSAQVAPPIEPPKTENQGGLSRSLTLKYQPIEIAHTPAIASLKEQFSANFKSDHSLKSGDGSGSKESLSIPLTNVGNQAKFASYGLSGGRDKFVMAVTETSSKFTKVQVCTPHVYGQVVAEVDVHEWDNRLRHMICTDKRPQFATTSGLELVTDPAHPQRCSITLLDSKMEVAQFDYVREKLKLQITTTLAGVGSPSFTLSGGLGEAKCVVVMKAHNSREQKLLGEVFGKQPIRKTKNENRWAVSFDIEDSVFSQILMMGIVYVGLSGGSSKS